MQIEGEITYTLGNSQTSLDAVIITEQSERMKSRSRGKYTYMLGAVSLLSNGGMLINKERGRGPFPILETAYHFGRMLDDMADGDAKLPENYPSFESLTLHLKKSLKINPLICEAGEIEYLMRIAINDLTQKEQKKGEVVQETERFLDALLFDHQRRVGNVVLDQKELLRVYEESFGAPTNISLIALGSPTRDRDIWELGIAQGRAFAVMDLETDISKGICNIPKEILDESGLDFATLMDNPKLVHNNLILQNWMQSEIQISMELINQLKEKRLDPKAWALTRFMALGVTRKWKQEQ